MDTKLKGDIAEQAVVLQALKRGWGVLRPVGDRLPYDLVFDIGSRLVKIQVKANSIWVLTDDRMAHLGLKSQANSSNPLKRVKSLLVKNSGWSIVNFHSSNLL
jgi:NADH dehydrogenase/NADH:ubiquinone oxidoreductase subunit G